MHEPCARRQRDVRRRQEGGSCRAGGVPRAVEVLLQRVAVPEAGEVRPCDSARNPRVRPEYLLKVGAGIECIYLYYPTNNKNKVIIFKTLLLPRLLRY